MVRKPGLGRGLDALIPRKQTTATPQAATAGIAAVQLPHHAPPAMLDTETAGTLLSLSTAELFANPNQPRKRFTDAEIDELAATIAEKGILQPLLVRRRAGRYEIVSGERRWRAAQRANLERVPVRLVEYDDLETLQVAIIENIQREALSPIEEARAYQQLRDQFGMKQEDIAKRVGKARSSVAASLATLALPAAVLDLVEAQKLSLGHLKVLLSVEGPRDGTPNSPLMRFALAAAETPLSVRELEAQIARSGDAQEAEQKHSPTKSKPAKAQAHSPEVKKLLDELERSVGTRVTLLHKRGAASGRLVLHYHSMDELGRLIRKLKA